MIATALALSLVLTRGCRETSDSEAVGFAHCRRFGAWASEAGPHFEVALTAGVGWLSLVPDSSGTELSLGAGKTAKTINSFAPGALGGGRLQLADVAARIDLVRWGLLRGGVSFSQGLATDVAGHTMSPVGVLPLHDPQIWTLGLPAGVDLRWRRVALSADVSPALTTFSVGVTNDLSLDRPLRVAVIVGAALRFWITPAIAIEATGSVDLLELDRVSAGLRLHLPGLSAFDGVDAV